MLVHIVDPNFFKILKAQKSGLKRFTYKKWGGNNLVNKKVFLTFISLILIFIVAGCSDKSSGEGQSEDGVVTIDFWSAESPGSKQDKAIKEQISKFEKEHPKIKINQQSMTYDMMYDNLITAINAGNTPDISWGLSEWFGEFNSFDALLDLTP